jgi:Domain of unknown function (DUF4397)
VKIRFWMPLFACVALLLNACGGSGSSGDGQVRLVNATTEFASLDFFEGDNLLTSDVTADGAGAYSTLGAATYSFVLKNTGTTTTVATTSRAITGDTNNTLVAYKTNGVLTTAYLTDNEEAPTTGAGKIRVFNTSNEAGAVDVFVTSATTDLTGASPTLANVAGERASVYSELTAGTYRIRVTASGNSEDLRLDIPAVELVDQQIATLILTTTPGGVLVNGLIVNQGEEATGYRNASARVRVVAGATTGGTVSATIGGEVIATSLRSPAITAYTLVTAGALPATITVNGVAAPAQTITVAAGTETTVMVLGAAGAATITSINDDNKPSTNSTLPVRLRLVNGVNGLDDVITLSADYDPIANNVAFGEASIPANVAESETVRLEVTSPAALLPLFLAEDVRLQAGKVYTLFMLGDNGSQIGALRADR